MTPLPWGRRLLMCPPDYFAVRYEINPWMHIDSTPDPDAAAAQFAELVTTLRRCGADIELLEPVDGLPDLVFTANAGVVVNAPEEGVDASTFIPARFRYAQRQGEAPYDVAWFRSHGFRIRELPASGDHEGSGDTLPFFPDDRPPFWVSAYRFRSDIATHSALSTITGHPVKSVELTDPRFYHLDLTFCPLDSRRAMVSSTGIDAYGIAVLADAIPELLLLDDDETASFCANSVVIGDNIVMPACPPRIGRALEAWGFSVCVVAVDEFLKAGGGCRCLTLALDVSMGHAPTHLP